MSEQSGKKYRKRDLVGSPRPLSHISESVRDHAGKYVNVYTVAASIIFGIAGLAIAYSTLNLNRKQVQLLEYQNQPVFDISISGDNKSFNNGIKKINISQSGSNYRNATIFLYVKYAVNIFQISGKGTDKQQLSITHYDFGEFYDPRSLTSSGGTPESGTSMQISNSKGINITLAQNYHLPKIIAAVERKFFKGGREAWQIQVWPEICAQIDYVDVFKSQQTEMLCQSPTQKFIGDDALKWAKDIAQNPDVMRLTNLSEADFTKRLEEYLSPKRTDK